MDNDGGREFGSGVFHRKFRGGSPSEARSLIKYIEMWKTKTNQKVESLIKSLDGGAEGWMKNWLASCDDGMGKEAYWRKLKEDFLEQFARAVPNEDIEARLLRIRPRKSERVEVFVSRLKMIASEAENPNDIPDARLKRLLRTFLVSEYNGVDAQKSSLVELVSILREAQLQGFSIWSQSSNDEHRGGGLRRSNPVDIHRSEKRQHVGGTTEVTSRPGDWICSCGFMNFKSRNECLKCHKRRGDWGDVINKNSDRDTRDYSIRSNRDRDTGDDARYRKSNQRPRHSSEWKCQHCGFSSNYSNRDNCFKCHKKREISVGAIDIDGLEERIVGRVMSALEKRMN